MPSKILVIDDERPTLSMFKLFLDAYGYEVFTAENGAEGIALFKEHSIPIVLTDIKMPGMDGMEVLKRIKEIDTTTEVIIITGHGDMDLALKALGLGATDFINKPIQQSNLDAALKRAEERLIHSHDDNVGYAVRKQNGTAIISVHGAINSGTEKRLDDAFTTALDTSKQLILSFSEDVSINGAGMALLTQHLLECREKSTKVVLCGLSESIEKVIDMVGIGKLAIIHDTEEKALNGF